jgi:hypothetical protein
MRTIVLSIRKKNLYNQCPIIGWSERIDELFSVLCRDEIFCLKRKSFVEFRLIFKCKWKERLLSITDIEFNWNCLLLRKRKQWFCDLALAFVTFANMSTIECFSSTLAYWIFIREKFFSLTVIFSFGDHYFHSDWMENISANNDNETNDYNRSVLTKFVQMFTMMKMWLIFLDSTHPWSTYLPINVLIQFYYPLNNFIDNVQ